MKPNGSKKEYRRFNWFATEMYERAWPYASMLEWLCAQLMEAEVSGIVGAEKNAHNPSDKVQ
jgi:hypothetical protein